MAEIDRYLETNEVAEIPSNMPINADDAMSAYIVGNKVREAEALGENIYMGLDDDTISLLMSRPQDDPNVFIQKFNGLPEREQDKLRDNLYQNETSDVVQQSTRIAIDKMSGLQDVQQAKGFIDAQKLNIKTIEKKLKDREQQEALEYADYSPKTADRIVQNWNKYYGTIDTFNKKYLEYIKPAQSKSIAKRIFDPREWAEEPDLDDPAVVNKLLDEALQTEKDRLNYRLAQSSYLFSEGYPIDYEPTELDPEKYTLGLEPKYPEIALAIGATTGGLSGAVGALAVELPIDSMFDEAFEDTGQAGQTAASILLLLGAAGLSESALVKLLGRSSALTTPIRPDKALALGSNKLVSTVKAAADFDDIALNPQIYEDMFGLVMPESRSILRNALPSVGDAKHLEYLMPKMLSNDSDIELFTFKGVDSEEATRVLTGINALQMDATTNAVKPYMDELLFEPYNDVIDKAFKAGDTDSALELINQHANKSWELSKKIKDHTSYEISPFPESDGVIGDMITKNFLGTMPEQYKELLLEKPNALFNLSSSLKRNMGKVTKWIDTNLSKSEKAKFNEIIVNSDSNIPVEPLAIMSPKVKKAVTLFRNTNDSFVAHANRAFSEILSDKKVFELDGDIVKVVGKNSDTNQLRVLTKELDTLEVDESDLNRISQILDPKKNYMHRYKDSDSFAVTMEIDGKFQRIVETNDIRKIGAMKKEFEALREAKDPIAKGSMHIHRANTNPAVANRSNKFAHLTNDAQAGFTLEDAEDIDRVMDMMASLGVNKYSQESIEAVEDIVNWAGERFGVRNPGKAVERLAGGKIVGRKLEKALRYEEFIDNTNAALESMNSYSQLLGDLTTIKPYADKTLTSFKKVFKDNIVDMSDPLGKLKKTTNDPSGSQLKAAKIAQRQINSMYRVPQKSTRWASEKMDSLMWKANEGKGKWLGFDKALHKFGAHKINSALNLYSTGMAMAGNLAQAPLQASFAQFGLVSHWDLFAKNPKLMGNYLNKVMELSKYVTARSLGAGRFIDISNPEIKRLYKTIDDNGWLADIMGTEVGGKQGTFLHGLASKGLVAATAGEGINKLSSIVIADILAQTQHKLKPGTDDYNMFVSSYFPKYSQIFNELTDSELTQGFLIGGTIGKFKKFQIQYSDQLYKGLKRKEFWAVTAASLALYGAEGTPITGEMEAAYDLTTDTFWPMYVQNFILGLDNAENFTVEQAEEYIRSKDMSKVDTEKEIAAVKAAIDSPERKKYYAEMNEKRMIDILQAARMGDDLDSVHEIKKMADSLFHYEGYAPNVADVVAWRSYIESIRVYGAESQFFGPGLTAMIKMVDPNYVGGVASKINTALHLQGRFGLDPVLSVTAEESRRAMKMFAPAPHKPMEGVLQLGRQLTAINDGDVYDENGNQMGFVDVFMRPTLQLDVPYEKVYSEKGILIKKPTSSIIESIQRVGSFEPSEIKEIERDLRDRNKHVKFILEPMLQNQAELVVSLYKSGQDQAGNEVLNRTMSILKNAYADEDEWEGILARFQRKVDRLEDFMEREARQLDESEAIKRANEIIGRTF